MDLVEFYFVKFFSERLRLSLSGAKSNGLSQTAGCLFYFSVISKVFHCLPFENSGLYLIVKT